MIEEVVAAMAIGGGLGNSWICALLSLGCSIEGKKSGIAFVAGRFLGLIILGVAIAGLGLITGLKPTYFLIAFGVLSIILGVIVLYQTLRADARRGHRHWEFPFSGGLRKRKDEVMANGGKPCDKFDSKPKTASFFVLGIFRGATPCFKVMVLAPLLISVDFWVAIVMVLAYAAVSTVYPAIGLLSGNLIRQWRKYTPHIRVIAAFIIILIGIYFVINAFGGHGH